MSEPGSRLPPDLPPGLPLTNLAVDTLLERIHREGLGPIWYGPSHGSAPVNRFDDPNGEFRVLYAAIAEEGAFAETFLRGRKRIRVLSLRETSSAKLSTLRVVRQLRLARLHGDGLARMGADAAIASGSYGASRTWSRALFEHPARVDGIIYRARHDDDLLAVAIFDRGENVVEPNAHPRALDREFLARMAARYGFGIIR